MTRCDGDQGLAMGGKSRMAPVEELVVREATVSRIE